MSIDQLELILYDMYHMDAWMPPLFGKWTEEFKKSSYSQWAVDELRDFIAEKISFNFFTKGEDHEHRSA